MVEFDRAQKRNKINKMSMYESSIENIFVCLVLFFFVLDLFICIYLLQIRIYARFSLPLNKQPHFFLSFVQNNSNCIFFFLKKPIIDESGPN